MLIEFEVVTVDSTGKIITRVLKQASYFTQAIRKGSGIEMIYIPGGSFVMGSPPGPGKSGEQPQHEVIVQAFNIGKYQITQAQWIAVAALPKIKRDLDPVPSYFIGHDRPVEDVSWYDAVEFCDRLSKHTNKEYRLPSEAEWEYAARAGTTTPYHFGETIRPELANYASGSKTSRKQTTDVGSFSPNAFGLYDIHGNVWEWCADTFHHNYQGAPTDGSAWINEDNNHYRIVRGGAWSFDPVSCRSASRTIASPDHRHYHFGFRVVCGGVAARTL